MGRFLGLDDWIEEEGERHVYRIEDGFRGVVGL